MKAMISYCSSLLSNQPSQKEWMEKVLPNMEFWVVLDTELNDSARYADIVCDAVPWQVWDSAQISDFIISYHREVPRGESFTLRRARPAEDTFYFEGEREGKSAFEAQLIFKHL